ncbi:MAG: outer membrane protein assembly factor BamA [Deltaproteobacteria bacterium]|nr:outer membrane protein assembly factor BamA [Deltaproteobacteria bacterium]MBW2047037.1 outer membrane protein assembly factor BamA [Deltaproteobacteria bacterium]MBW2110059.1 outer membrane protein assembly factor BamA [Deltaproteobacteria bacterium]MBW2351653.1 outer membrane protein assembly factor BamA [Deltaproteobacteria bacterium]
MVEYVRATGRARIGTCNGWGARPGSRCTTGQRAGRLVLQGLLLLILCAGFNREVPAAEKPGAVAVLPFKINAQEALDHLRLGLQEMLSSRLEQQGFRVISPEKINRYPVALAPSVETADLRSLGRDLNAHWVIVGSLTQVGNKGSIDLKVIDVARKRSPIFIFMVSEDIDALTDTMKRLAVNVSDRIMGVPNVDSVRVEGNRRVEAAAILAVIRTRAGDRLDYDKLDKDLRDIYKMGFFQDVKTETEDGPGGKIIIFHVSEKPSVGKIVFEGNDEIDDEDLQKELGIHLYSILDNNEVRQSINRLKELYREKGYYNAEIKEETEPLPNNEVMLKYKIDEHDKVYIEKIQFVGNKHFDDDELKDIMETSEWWIFSWITKAGILDRRKLEFDVHKISAFYHNHGFIKAKLGEPKVTYDDKLKGLVVTIDVVEGEQYGVGEVKVEGALIEPAEELLKKVHINQEKVFNRQVVRRDILALRDIYSDKGYAYSEVRPVVKEDDQEHLADITYHISKGPKVRFERITISGNTVTRDKVIRRELQVIEGEYFSGKKLKQSSANLARLGFFEDVQIETKKGSKDDLMRLNVKVKEQATRTFSVGAGYSSAYSAFVSFQIADENFLGYGQKLMASARIGGKNTEFDIRFLEPWLFDTRVSFGADLYTWDQEYIDYSRDASGAAITLGYPMDIIDRYTRISGRYDFDNSRIYDVVATEGPLYDMRGRNVTSSATIRLKRDSRDKLWNTSRGSINEISFQYAGLGGDEKFNKYRAKTAWFFPIFWDTVFMVQGRVGYIKDNGQLSVFQKFFLGGINTVRGYDYQTISPRDENGYLIGGTKMMCFNVEYRFPLFKEQGVVGLVFFDAGNAFDDSADWNPSSLKKSVGAGIRWYSPIGPLRLEYGFKLDREGDESSGKWEFSVGGML